MAVEEKKDGLIALRCESYAQTRNLTTTPSARYHSDERPGA